MLSQQLKLTTSNPLELGADTVVVEETGWLNAARGLAATIDGAYPELKVQREQAIKQRGGAFVPGEVVVCQLTTDRLPLRFVISAVTYAYQPQIGHAGEALRETPLVIARATRSALLVTAELGGRHVVLPALGTRTDNHVLPPVPKKLPRYVMGGAQLVAVQETLVTLSPIPEITFSLTQRDYAIFHELLGIQAAGRFSGDDVDE